MTALLQPMLTVLRALLMLSATALALVAVSEAARLNPRLAVPAACCIHRLAVVRSVHASVDLWSGPYTLALAVVRSVHGQVRTR